MNIDDCFRVLEIEKTFDKQIIKSAYRKLAKLYHPDTNQTVVDDGEFLKIKEAYDILLLYLEFRDTHGSTIGQMIIDEEKKREAEVAERVNKAYEKKKKKREDEQALYQRIYKRYMHSWRLYFAILLAIISIPVAVLLVCDFVMPGEISIKPVLAKTTTATKGQTINSWYNEYRIIVDGMSIPVSLEFFTICKTGKPVMLERSKYFGEIKYLYTKTDNFVLPEEPISFFNDAWLLFVILLLLPVVSFFFMKPTFIFVFFFVHYNLYLLPLELLYLLGGNARIVHVLDVLFH